MLILLVVFCSIPSLIYFSFKLPPVQNYLQSVLKEKLSRKFETKITFDFVDFSPFSRLVFKNFCVYSQTNDTILFSKQLITGIDAFSLTSKKLFIRTIALRQPTINFRIDSTKTINFQFIINKVVSKDTTSKGGMDFGINRMKITDGVFKLQNYDTLKVSYGINFTDMLVSNLQLDASNFSSKGGITSFRLRHMSCNEKSGFYVEKFASRVVINKNNLDFNGVTIKTKNSDIDAEQIRLSFSAFRDMGKDFINKVKLTVNLNKSIVSTDDIAYFAPKLKDYHFVSTASGIVTGRVSSLKGKNLELEFGSSSYLNANVDITGLPDITSSFMFIDVKKFRSTPGDLQALNLPRSKTGHLTLPKAFDQISYLTYRGKFTGFINDFVAYGISECNLGRIESDLSLKPDTSKSFKFKGQLKAINFNVGKLLKQSPTIGNISFNAMVDGKSSVKKGISAKMNGLISSFNLKQYDYKNIQVDATLSNKTFDGSLNISDPNIDLNFIGKVNLANKVPEFNFSASLNKANLYKLHIDTIDTASLIALNATADFAGSNIDNLDGEIKLVNADLKKTGKEVHVNDFLLFTKTINDTKRIIIRSSLADAEIWGTYQFAQLGRSFQWLLNQYLPSLTLNIPPEVKTLNNFSFEAEFKDTRQFTDFFVPGLYVSRDSKLTGEYNPTDHKVKFLFSIPFLNFKGKKWYDLYINGESNSEVLSINSGCSSLKLSKQLSLDNLTILADASKDSVQLTTRWNNWDSIQYKGNIKSVISFNSKGYKKFPQMNARLYNSQFILHDTAWSIQPSVISIDSSGLIVKNLRLTYNDQEIFAEGAISKKPNEKMFLSLKNLDISVLNSFLPQNLFLLEGIANGKAEFSDVFKNPYFHADVSVDSLGINHETLGNTELVALWNNSDKSIDLKLTALRGELKTMEAKGLYYTQSKVIDGNIKLNKLKANIFQPFAKFLISDLRGLATGNLDVTGTINKPLFNGEINAEKTSFTINYLKTRYTFTKQVKIENNTILFDNLVLSDNRGNRGSSCRLDGRITHNYFKNFYFNLVFRANNFEFLNTTEKDNNLFFGQAYGTGNIEIVGPPKNLTINVTAKTEANTDISIPLGNRTTEISEARFIRFVDKRPKVTKPEYDYELEQANKNQSSVSLSGLKLNFDRLEVTPVARVKIIFDPKIGDMIQGSGSGILRMNINTLGQFSMYGDLNIEQGDYLFTLQNVINRKFKIEQGGTISWNGNPIDATINLQAIYPLRASLRQLFPEDQRYTNNIPVNCLVNLSGKLMNPTPQLGILLPNADMDVQTKLNSVINTQEELNNQFLSLMVQGQFMPLAGIANNSSSSSSSSSSYALGNNGMEFLSNQLNHMLSQISQDFDIGFNYRPASTMTSQELEMMMSWKLLNDRITINGNFGVGGSQNASSSDQSDPTKNKTNPNNLVGDVEVEYKPFKSNKVRLKAFNRSNETYIDQQSQYVQGIGISYKEEFNSFGELFRKYWRSIFAKKEEDVKVKEGPDTTQNTETDN